MDLVDDVVALIDTRSFSSLWYWIAVAVLWSSASHFVLGIPFDMVTRARRRGAEALADLEALAHLQVRRRLQVMRTGGAWVVGVTSAVLSAVFVLGFLYGVELLQALFLLLFPLSMVNLMALRAAARIEAEHAVGDQLIRRLSRLRFWIQLLGMMSVFVTALWGMWRLMSISVLGG